MEPSEHKPHARMNPVPEGNRDREKRDLWSGLWFAKASQANINRMREPFEKFRVPGGAEV